MQEAKAVRFIRTKVKGTRTAKFAGKGTFEGGEDKFIFRGKKLLPLWVQVVIFFGVGFLLRAIGLGFGGFLLAFLIDIFARTNERAVLPRSTLKEIIYELKGRKLLLTGIVEGGPLTSVGFQVPEGFDETLETLRQEFSALIKEGRVTGSKTF